MTLLTVAIATPLVDAQPRSRYEDTHVVYHNGLSVGAFGPKGREQGVGGGYKFSGVTLSVQALSGEAALLVKDQNGRNGLAVRPDGDVYVEGDLLVYGQKRFVQADPEDPRRLISYVSLEGPEAGTYLRGSARLVDGRAVIRLPRHFALVTAADGLTVTATPTGRWLALYVAEKSTSRIVVREAEGRDGEFDYLVQGVRRGHEDFRAVEQRPAAPPGDHPRPATSR